MWFKLIVISSLMLGVGCKEQESLSPEVQRLGRATGPVVEKKGSEQPSEPMAPSGGKVLSGRVLETMEASRYTYLQLETQNKDKLWVAIPKTQISAGQEVEVVESIVMKDFKSPTLNRSFPTIVFGVLKGHEQQPTAQ